MKACPRCQSPFVEANQSYLGVHPADQPTTEFKCHVCMMQFSVPLPMDKAVEQWDSWDRVNPMEVSMTTLRSQLAMIERNATRLERLIIGLMGSEHIRPHPSQEGHSGAEAWGRGIVALARIIESEIEQTKPKE